MSIQERRYAFSSLWPDGSSGAGWHINDGPLISTTNEPVSGVAKIRLQDGQEFLLQDIQWTSGTVGDPSGGTCILVPVAPPQQPHLAAAPAPPGLLEPGMLAPAPTVPPQAAQPQEFGPFPVMCSSVGAPCYVYNQSMQRQCPLCFCSGALYVQDASNLAQGWRCRDVPPSPGQGQLPSVYVVDGLVSLPYATLPAKINPQGQFEPIFPSGPAQTGAPSAGFPTPPTPPGPPSGFSPIPPGAGPDPAMMPVAPPPPPRIEYRVFLNRGGSGWHDVNLFNGAIAPAALAKGAVQLVGSAVVFGFHIKQAGVQGQPNRLVLFVNGVAEGVRDIGGEAALVPNWAVVKAEIERAFLPPPLVPTPLPPPPRPPTPPVVAVGGGTADPAPVLRVDYGSKVAEPLDALVKAMGGESTPAKIAAAIFGAPITFVAGLIGALFVGLPVGIFRAIANGKGGEIWQNIKEFALSFGAWGGVVSGTGTLAFFATAGITRLLK